MITFDFEGRAETPLTGMRSVGSYRYAVHVNTQVLCAAWLFDDDPQPGHWHCATTGQGEWDPVEESDPEVLDELIRRIEDGEPIEAHNAFFEQMVWEFTWLRQIPWMPLPKPDQWHCSAAKAASLALPRKLEVLAEVLGVSEQKDMEGHRVMLKLCKPARKTKDNPDREWYEDPSDLLRNWLYNKQDVRTEHAVSSQLRSLSPFEREVWLMDQRMNRRGVHCDREMVDAALELAADEVVSMNERISVITGGAVPKGSSRAKFKEWANSHDGVGLLDTKEATLSQAINKRDEDTIAEVMRIVIDVNKTSTRKYKVMLDRMDDFDDRVRDLMMYHGASTGRWAGTGLQPHSFPRGNIKDMMRACEAILGRDPEVIRFLYGSVMEHLSGSTRGALTAPEGRDLIVADYSAIEARDVFWLADDTKGLEDFRAYDAGEGPEVYCVMAESIFGYPVNKDDHFIERFVGKQSILGCGYGMGPDKYYDTCKKFKVILPMDTCRKAIDTYRDVHEPVKQEWYRQEAAAKEAVQNKGRTVKAGKVKWAVRGHFLHCQLPSGRLLSYYKPWIGTMLNFRFKIMKSPELESSVSINQDPRYGEAKAFVNARLRAETICKEADWELVVTERPRIREQSVLRFWGVNSKTKKWERKETYGGMLVENIVQAIARDQLAEAMVRIDLGEVYDMLMSVHDEAVAEVDEGAGDLREFEHEMAIPPVWCLDAPLIAVGWRGKRYRKA